MIEPFSTAKSLVFDQGYYSCYTLEPDLALFFFFKSTKLFCNPTKSTLKEA